MAAGRLFLVSTLLVVWGVVGLGTAMAQQGGAGQAEVRVVDSEGGAVAGADVSLTGDDGKTSTAATDEAGVARFEALAPGSYEVEVRIGGELVSRGIADVTADATALLRSVVSGADNSGGTVTKGVPSWVFPLMVVMGVILALLLPWVFGRLAARRERQADALVEEWSASLPPPPEGFPSP